MRPLILLAFSLLSVAPASAQTAVLSWRGASMGACLESDPDQCLSVSIEQRLDNPEVNNPVGTFLSYILTRFEGGQWVTVQAVFQQEVPALSVRIAANASRASLNLPTIRGVWTANGAWQSAGNSKDLLKTPTRQETTTANNVIRYGRATVEFEGEVYTTTGETANPLEDGGSWGSIAVGVHRVVVRE